MGIATGPAKEYALHIMVAALRNLDWPNLEIHWAATQFVRAKEQSEKFYDELCRLMETVDWPCPWFVHRTYVDVQKVRHVRRDLLDGNICVFDMVINNLQKLRGEFLDGDAEYFLEVGGDNPPPRMTVRRLMKLNVDVAFGLCFQRPERDAIFAEPYPLVWLYSWQMKDLEQFGLEPELKLEFEKAFENCPFLIPVYALKNWRRKRVLSNVASGTGMVLIKRRVLENVGWRLPPSRYSSEDLYFCHACNLRGYSTKIDLKLHVPHFDEDGFVY